MNDNSENRDLQLDEAGGHVGLAAAAPQPAFVLDEDERLPWLESAEDDDDGGAIDTGRLLRFVAFAVALLALILGGVWLLNHRGNPNQGANGAVIAAPAEPYKTEPTDKGGKTFAGTGDSAYAASEGKAAPAKLAGSDAPVAGPSPSASPSASAGPRPGASAAAGSGAGAAAGKDADAAPGVGVQVGAYSSRAAAEAGWSRLSNGQAALKGLKHRVLEGSADIGTVYRLQAVAGDLAAANALCAQLKTAGVACQVKH